MAPHSLDNREYKTTKKPIMTITEMISETILIDLNPFKAKSTWKMTKTIKQTQTLENLPWVRIRKI